MADTFSAKAELKTSVQQTLDSAGALAASSPKITHSGWNFEHTLSATTTPAFTKHAVEQKALAAGAGTIDLTATKGVNDEAVDGTGLKVQVFKARNPSTNANSITLTFGAANPYLLAGAAWKIILEPGMEIMLYGNDATPAIGAASCEIDLAGTLVQALDVEILMG